MKSSYQARTGHQRTRITKASLNSDATQRRKNALERLKAQLESGLKPPKSFDLIGLTGSEYFVKLKGIPLTKQDIVRIQKEIQILESKI